MRPATGGSEPDDLEERDWILRCEGFQVYDAGGELVGVVTAVVYDHSARWDAPHGLKVRATTGETTVAPLEWVTAVDEAAARISLRPLESA